MAEIAKKYRDQLPELKSYVEAWHDYFCDNNKRFDEFRRFVFETSLTERQLDTLRQLNKPPLQFNITEAYLSRLRGNFAEHEPSVAVRCADGLPPSQITENLIKTQQFVEDHMRQIFSASRNDALEYDIYTDCLAGGFSGIVIGTEYINERSFDQRITVKKVYDPTNMGFDPMARESHKGDGKFCFEIIPMTREDFEYRYGKGSSNTIKFNRKMSGFNWSYRNQVGDMEVVNVVYLYKKVCKEEKIAKLSNGKTILSKHYADLMELWDKYEFLEQAPLIVKERKTEIETVELFEFCEDKLFKHTPTSFEYLPIVFVDGNSTDLRNGTEGELKQFTRPYLYHAKDVQNLKNYAGQTLGAEIENMVQHKFMAAKESIPPEYQDAYDNPQEFMTLVYNAFKDGDASQPIPPPREISRIPTPPIVESIFNGTDAVTQAILGSYDAVQGNLTERDLSGKAIQAGAVQSDAAAKPYMMGYIRAMNRASQIILDLIPKYYVTPRSIPVERANGIREFEIINDPQDDDSLKINYEPHSLQVEVTMGVNSTTQKQIALEHIIRLMDSSELFNEFINSEGLEALLDNIEIRGIDRLKALAVKFMEQRKQAMAEQANQPSPEQQFVQAQMQIEQEKTEQKREEAGLKHEKEMSELELKEQQALTDSAIKQEQVRIDKEQKDLEWLKAMAEIRQAATKQEIEAFKAQTEAFERDARVAEEQIQAGSKLLQEKTSSDE